MEKNKFLAYPEGQVSGSELDGQDSEPEKYFLDMLVLRHFRRQCALQLEGEYCTEAVDSQNPPCSLPPFVL